MIPCHGSEQGDTDRAFSLFKSCCHWVDDCLHIGEYVNGVG
jgi:hypothetical protein